MGDDDFKFELFKSEERRRVLKGDPAYITDHLALLERLEKPAIRWSQKRYSERGAVAALYELTKAGDLVVIPGPGLTLGPDRNWLRKMTMVGEITDDKPVLWGERGIPYVYQQGRYLVRSVKWLSELNEFRLSPSVEKALRTQNPVVRVDKNSLEDALSAAYQNVLFREEFIARFITNTAEFTAKDSYHFQAFVMAIVAMYADRQTGECRVDLTRSIYEIAALNDVNPEFIPDQDANIHSPGYTTLKALGLGVTFAIAALFALALSPRAQEADAKNVSVVNSGTGVPHECVTKTDEAVKEILTMMGHKRWQELCVAAEKAHGTDGLVPVTTVQESD